MGSVGSRQPTAVVENRGRRSAFMVLGSLDRAQNDYTYFSRALARDVELRNADRRQASLYGTGEVSLGDADIRASAMFLDGERGLPASAAGVTSDERQWDRTTRAWADVEAGNLTIGASLHRGLIDRKSVV